jgi:hypothetical protein
MIKLHHVMIKLHHVLIKLQHVMTLTKKISLTFLTSLSLYIFTI